MADAHYSNVALLLPMNGADGGTVFTDYSPSLKTVTHYGDAHTETDQYKYYGSSGAFDGNGDYLTLTPITDFIFGTGDFTIEMYIRPSTVSPIYQGLFETRNNDSQIVPLLSLFSGVPTFWVNTSAKIQGSLLDINTWYHLALCRYSGTTKMFVGGTQVGSDYTDANNYTAYNVYIGRHFDGNYYTGYMQDLRITKGVARYTANFTPPGKLCGTISGTVYDAAGDPAQRTVIAVPRVTGCGNAWSAQSSAVDGTYSLTVPDAECSRLVLADETTLYNDLVDRVLPG